MQKIHKFFENHLLVECIQELTDTLGKCQYHGMSGHI